MKSTLITDVASAFARKEPLIIGSATSTGDSYSLFGNTIASWHGSSVIFYWRDYYTASTARHMNNILRALCVEERVSHAAAQREQQQTFVVEVIK